MTRQSYNDLAKQGPENLVEQVLSSLAEAQALCNLDIDIKRTSDLGEFAGSLDAIIEKLEAERERYEERMALQAIHDGLTTSQRAIAALQRPERFNGKHDVARAWLREEKSHEGIFRKVSA